MCDSFCVLFECVGGYTESYFYRDFPVANEHFSLFKNDDYSDLYICIKLLDSNEDVIDSLYF